MADLNQPPAETASLLRSRWEQAREMCPQIRPGLRVERRHYRGEQWYVLQQEGRSRLHRINASAWFVLGRCDGHTPLATIFSAMQNATAEPDAAPGDGSNNAPALTETGLLQLIARFAQEGLLSINGGQTLVSPHANRSQRWRDRLKNPLSIRIPLWDPHRFLLRYQARVAPLFTRAGFWLWLLLVASCAFIAAIHWNEITADVIDRIFAPGNLLWLWLIYPATKLIHELGHAFATRLCGGEVHEIGIMVVFGVPLPYVDASAASGFPDKRHRLLVDAAGIMVELALASLALLIWLAAEPGLLRQLAYNTMLICSVSTLLFNGNPLARFDGYYLLADWLEIPNLGARSAQYWRHLAKRYLFGVREAIFAADKHERLWLAGYGVGALYYRTALLILIVWIAAQYHLLLGFALGVFFIVRKVLLPTQQLLRYLAGEQLGSSRRQARWTLMAMALAALLVLFVIPAPVQRVLPAILWLPEHTVVRARTAGFIDNVAVAGSSSVEAGQLLFTLADPYLQVDRAEVEARRVEAQARYEAARIDDIAEAMQLQEEMKSLQRQAARIDQRIAQLVINSPQAGVFYLPPGVAPPTQRFVPQGEVLAYVIAPHAPVLRALVSQDDMGLIRNALQHRPEGIVEAWIANGQGRPVNGRVTRIVPEASDQLPDAALGSQGGGGIAVDPRDPQGLRALTQWFQLEVTLDAAGMAPGWPGTRAWVRIDLDSEPLGAQLYRHLRQNFLNTLSL